MGRGRVSVVFVAEGSEFCLFWRAEPTYFRLGRGPSTALCCYQDRRGLPIKVGLRDPSTPLLSAQDERWGASAALCCARDARGFARWGWLDPALRLRFAGLRVGGGLLVGVGYALVRSRYQCIWRPLSWPRPAPASRTVRYSRWPSPPRHRLSDGPKRG